MKILIYNRNSESINLRRMGLLLEGDIVADLRAGYALYLTHEKGNAKGKEIAHVCMPRPIADFLQLGPAAFDILNVTHEMLNKLARSDRAATGLDGEPLFSPFKECRLHAPLRPSKIIAVGLNYREHMKEGGFASPMKVPSAWIKANSSIIGPTRDIEKPAIVHQLDYETELAVVIGQRCKNVPEEKAYDVIAGYMVANDISARDIIKVERQEGNQLLGKMFDTFFATGPWIVTKDEIPDPMNLAIMTRVNGETRQNSNTGDMIWSIPKLIAYLSQMTLEPGDVISTGTPEGVALGRKPAQTPWWLREGDLLESEVEKIGVLRNKIVAESTMERSWRW
ncbi:MAG: fumarylacetoacetate hydrolase family protein [Betaproteobacteria bacterium]|nr:fumarylacetoacetate hydrolase family protein [Betaproteobacteria bacterium]